MVVVAAAVAVAVTTMVVVAAAVAVVATAAVKQHRTKMAVTNSPKFTMDTIVLSLNAKVIQHPKRSLASQMVT